MLRVSSDIAGNIIMTGSNIRRYVLYLYIETLKQRLDAINQLRVDRACCNGTCFPAGIQSAADITALSPSADAGLP